MWNQIIVKNFQKNKNQQTKNKRRYNSNNFQKSYLLSEIVFNLESETLNEKYEIIKKKFLKWFKNAASIFSISDSAKNGGNRLDQIKLIK